MVAATGWVSGQASEACGAGLWNSSRVAVATALSGFHSAIWRSGAGRPADRHEDPGQEDEREEHGEADAACARLAVAHQHPEQRPDPHAGERPSGRSRRVGGRGLPHGAVRRPPDGQPADRGQRGQRRGASARPRRRARPASTDAREIGSARRRSIEPGLDVLRRADGDAHQRPDHAPGRTCRRSGTRGRSRRPGARSRCRRRRRRPGRR